MNSPKSIFAALLLMIVSQFLPTSFAFAKELTGDEIVAKADIGKLSIGSVSFTAKSVDYGAGKMLRETRYRVLTSGKKASKVETVFPERQRGRKLLMDKDNLWLYTPNTKRPARVSMQQRLTGEISNGDLARTNFAGDYDATLIDKVKLNGVLAYHLNLKANRSGVTYSKIEYWVNASDFLPMKANFYAVSGKLLKTGIYMNPDDDVLGHRCITKVVFSDAMDARKKSELYYSDFKKEKENANAFSKEFLGD